jgi:hypothetical protein
MKATKPEELRIYQKALEGALAISALLNHPGLRTDFKLRSQLSDASDSTCSNITEGFGQQSDRKFAQYLYDVLDWSWRTSAITSARQNSPKRMRSSSPSGPTTNDQRPTTNDQRLTTND